MYQPTSAFRANQKRIYSAGQPDAPTPPRSPSLDRSFGKRGETAVRIPGGNDEVHAVALDSNHRIVVTGKPAYSLARLKPSGKLNHSFGHHGTVTKNFGEGWSLGLAIDTGDRPVVAGGYPDFVLGRFIG